MSEPHKRINHLTDLGKLSEESLAWMYDAASLHAIDVFFMRLRRRINLLERGINTASNAGRIWHGYSPYNPAMVIRALNIFRAVHNYVETNDKGQTPAMRLGLAKGPVSLEKILYFKS